MQTENAAVCCVFAALLLHYLAFIVLVFCLVTKDMNDFDETIVIAPDTRAPQLELFRDIAPQAPFIGIVPAEQYAWLASDRRGVYATILYFLYLRRKAHEIEKYHNDVYDAVQPAVEELTCADYSLNMFRADMDQLVAWGNLERRLEPYRLQRISDRRLQKFLYRLGEHTRVLLDSLVSLRAPSQFERVLLDQDHLLDIEEQLERAEHLRAKQGALDEDQLRRLARCFVEIDGKCRLIATEITEFGARIAAFNTAPFQYDTLPEIIDWLDRYVDQYLQRVAKLGPELHRRLRSWGGGDARRLLETAQQATREHLLANPLAGPWADQLRSAEEMLTELIPFFAPEGLFAELCQRVNEHVRALVRKIRQYLEDIRRRNIRMQALRKRTRELLRAGDTAVLTAVSTWLNELIGSAHQRNDAAGGTPSRRAAPPRPTYWRRRVARPPFLGSVLAPKTGSLDRTRELERARLLRLGRFIQSTILANGRAARAAQATLATPADVRHYLDAVKAHTLGRKRDRDQLSYRIAPPSRASQPASFRGAQWAFTSPDYTFEQSPDSA
jgi:hypothetical protein